MSGTHFDDGMNVEGGEGQAGQPLLSDFGAQEAMPGGGVRSNKSRRMGVAALIILGAAGGIFLMRQVGLGAASVIAAIVVDYDPNEFTKGPGDPAVLDELARSRLAVQVPAEVFEQDPFVLEPMAIEAETQQAQAEPEFTDEELALQRLAQEAESAAEQIEVQSVMGGPIPLARINGSIYRLGDTVLEVLQVTAIDGREVVMQGGETIYGFAMGEPGVLWRRPAAGSGERTGGP